MRKRSIVDEDKVPELIPILHPQKERRAEKVLRTYEQGDPDATVRNKLGMILKLDKEKSYIPELPKLIFNSLQINNRINGWDGIVVGYDKDNFEQFSFDNLEITCTDGIQSDFTRELVRFFGSNFPTSAETTRTLYDSSNRHKIIDLPHSGTFTFKTNDGTGKQYSGNLLYPSRYDYQIDPRPNDEWTYAITETWERDEDTPGEKFYTEDRTINGSDFPYIYPLFIKLENGSIPKRGGKRSKKNKKRRRKNKSRRNKK